MIVTLQFSVITFFVLNVYFQFLVKDNERENSPFHKYYMNKINQYSNSKKSPTDEVFVDNEFFNQDLFEVLKERMFLLPIWSGIMIDENMGKTRLSNNPCENWFGQLKHNILKDSEVLF